MSFVIDGRDDNLLRPQNQNPCKTVENSPRSIPFERRWPHSTRKILLKSRRAEIARAGPEKPHDRSPFTGARGVLDERGVVKIYPRIDQSEVIQPIQHLPRDTPSDPERIIE